MTIPLEDKAIERAEVVSCMGEYLYDQMNAHPDLAEWIALDLIAHLVRVAKSNGMPGAVRVLIDATGDVEAMVTLTPAGPPSPPATPAAAGRSRRRWWGMPRVWQGDQA